MSRSDSECAKDVGKVLKDCEKGFLNRLKDCRGIFERKD